MLLGNRLAVSASSAIAMLHSAMAFAGSLMCFCSLAFARPV